MADSGAAQSGPAHSDDEEITPGYVAPAKKTVGELAELDQDDEALVKYKQALLGNAASGCTTDDLKVTVTKMIFMSQGRDDIELDLTGDLSKIKQDDFTINIKEGCEYRLKFTFNVANQIVSGLRFHQNISRKGMPIDKINLMLGSFGPREEAHEFTNPPDEAPKGLMARGKYHAKCKFIDDDKTVHLAWNWSFKIQQEW